MDPDDLESVVDRALKALPAPRAPETLLPRVMDAVPVEARMRPRSGTWFTWPIGWQIAFVALVILLAGGLGWLLPTAQAAVVSSVSGMLTGVKLQVAGMLDEASAIVSMVTIVWQALLQPVVRWVFIFILAMSVACAAFGAALGRVALGGASQS
jgi:hypothetical protein